jgi:hypothetical protein
MGQGFNVKIPWQEGKPVTFRDLQKLINKHVAAGYGDNTLSLLVPITITCPDGTTIKTERKTSIKKLFDFVP